MLLKRILLAGLTLYLFGCQNSIPKKHMWTGTITISEDKPIPFRMFLDLNNSRPSGFFLNGDERTEIPEIYFNGDSLSLIFSEYNARMLGIWNGKEWRGQFFRYRGDTLRNDFVSAPKEYTDTIRPDIQTEPSLSGKFQAFIHEQKGIDSTTFATFSIKNDSIYGTLFAGDGDYGLFTGTQTGSRAVLSRFTGWQAFVMELEHQDLIWKGKLYSRSGQPMSFTLVPRPSFFPEPETMHKPTVKDPFKSFYFSGISITDQNVTNLDDRFKNKALIIDIMGTWCHNCLDATPLLQRLYSEFHKDGLEIVGLAFEITGNRELAKKNLSLFQKRYGIDYTLLFCGSTKNADKESDILRQINDFYGYPTTIFIDRKGRVKEIHVGFNGPATGEEYQTQVRKYYRIVSEILK